MSALVALLLAQAVPAAPALPPVTVVAAVDPARLAAAGVLIDVLMPQDSRDAMIDTMLRPMMANIQQAMTGDPSFQRLFDGNAAARGVFDRFLARRSAATLAKLQAEMPAMIEAMTRAYARRFTVEQMRELTTFFATPTGRIYMREATTIMADPDVQAWQRSLMRGAMGDMQGEVAQLVAELQATEKK